MTAGATNSCCHVFLKGPRAGQTCNNSCYYSKCYLHSDSRMEYNIHQNKKYRSANKIKSDEKKTRNNVNRTIGRPRKTQLS